MKNMRDEFEKYNVVRYTQELVSIESITPSDNGCQNFLIDKLSKLGFKCHSFIDNDVHNLMATYQSDLPGLSVAFCGHTDVVPIGDSSLWLVPPFSAEIINGELYGRGAADMKGGIAAMLSALERYVNGGHPITGTFYFLITSDEEGEAEHGSKAIVNLLNESNLKLDFCIIGEPTSDAFSGDTIKIGRRGALSCSVDVYGKAGHVAYPQYASNAVTTAVSVSNKLLNIKWDSGSDDLPGTNLEISGIKSNSFTDNIIPSHCHMNFNIRYSDAHTNETLRNLIHDELFEYGNKVELSWQRPCEPYLTNSPIEKDDCLLNCAIRAVHKVTLNYPKLSTSGGCSDGRFFKEEHNEVLEIGLPNKTIHQVNEKVSVNELIKLENIYFQLLHEIYS